MFPYAHWGVGNPAAPRGPNPNVRPKWWIMWWNANHVTPKKLNYEKNSQWPPIVSLRFYCSLSGTRSIWIEPSDSYPLPKKPWYQNTYSRFWPENWHFSSRIWNGIIIWEKTQFRSKTADFTWFHDFHRIFQWTDIPIWPPYNFANDFHNFFQWALG